MYLSVLLEVSIKHLYENYWHFHQLMIWLNMAALMISENLWMLYFLLYSLFIFIMCFLFYIINIFYIFPQFGIFPKWMIINYLLYNNLFIISFTFIITSLIMLFIYIRIIYSSFMFYSIKLKLSKILLKNNFMIFISIFSFTSLLGMIISTLFFL